MSQVLKNSEDFFEKITDLLKNARKKTVYSINQTMVYTYFEIGKIIIEEEQKGRKRAEYGKQIIKELSQKLIKEFGKGFSRRNLEQMRQFYLAYSNAQALSAEFRLSWSHYLFLTRIDNENERKFYEIEAIESNWSLRELQRQFDSALFERLVLSRDKKDVKKLSEKGQIIKNPQDTLKDPYILEFLGLPEETRYSETDLEQKLIDKLENFLLELGKGYTFVGRQVRFTFDDKHFRIS